MCFQITTICECLVTFGTGKWLLSCVGPFMYLQNRPVTKCLVTFRAGKWLLSSVGSFMFLQSVFTVKCFVTQLAMKSFLYRVKGNSHTEQGLLLRGQRLWNPASIHLSFHLAFTFCGSKVGASEAYNPPFGLHLTRHKMT